MQISRLSAAATGTGAEYFPGGVAAATAALDAPAAPARLDLQLKAYHALSTRWREAGHGERAALAQALTDSQFARGVQDTLNTFTRAAWAGPDAAPPAPQARILKAFDALSDMDRRIVAAMHVDASGAPALGSPEAYRARLQSELDAAQSADRPTRRPDTVTLSEDAQARLAGGGGQDGVPEPPRAPAASHPAVAAAMAAYSKAAR